MMAVLPEFAIMRPFNLNWARELHLSQQELKDFIYTSGQSLELFVDVSREQDFPSHNKYTNY